MSSPFSVGIAIFKALQRPLVNTLPRGPDMTRISMLLCVGLCMAMMTSCARDEQRQVRYDAHQCPFCTISPGKCTYCNGTKKCTFCHGTGKRTTSTYSMVAPNIEHITYTEDCPYCKGTGVCRYCEGAGKCWGCKGSGKISSWKFFEKGQVP
jgi:hypothetical protein